MQQIHFSYPALFLKHTYAYFDDLRTMVQKEKKFAEIIILEVLSFQSLRLYVYVRTTRCILQRLYNLDFTF